MASTLGNLALWLSFLFSILQFILATTNNNSIFITNKVVVKGLLTSTSASFFLLMYCHVISDFAVINVFQNSHTTKPLLYKISGVWGNHEGSILLWLCMISIYGFLYSLISKSLNDFKIKVLKIQSALFVIFAMFIIFTSNPFLPNPTLVDEGLGLNPILQDPALAIHPPMLYLGYVGFSLVFSLAIASLLRNNNDQDWICLLYTSPSPRD